MPSTLKIDKIESRTPNAGLTVDWIGGGLKGPNNIPILTEDGKIVGDLLLLAQVANTPNTTTAALDFIREATPGQGIQFLDTVYGLSSANVVAIDLISTNGTFSTITTDTLTANTISVTGDLVVAGNTTTLDTQTLLVEDNIVVFGANNAADITDLGFAGQYNNGANTLYAGIFRDASDGKFYVFKDYPLEPPTSTLTGFNVNSMKATLVGNFEAVNSVQTPDVSAVGSDSLTLASASNDVYVQGVNVELIASNDIIFSAGGTRNIDLNASGGSINAGTHILPKNTSSENLGSSSKTWNNIYVDDLTLNTAVIAYNAANGTLNVSGNALAYQSDVDSLLLASLNDVNTTANANQVLTADGTGNFNFNTVDYNNLINKPDAQLAALADDAFINSIIFG